MEEVYKKLPVEGKPVKIWKPFDLYTENYNKKDYIIHSLFN